MFSYFVNHMGTVLAQNMILLANFVAVLSYVLVTRKIMRASIEQSEGLSKPVLTVRCKGEGLNGTAAEISGYDLEVINIGNGPAIRVNVKVNRRQLLDQPINSQPSTRTYPDISVPYLQPNRTILLPISRPHLQTGSRFGNVTCSVACSYKSISDVEYLSTITMEGTTVKDFKFCKSELS
jgi:hypothetical protein